ncbi:MAG: helix-turn-helix domain-containing protein [Clostridia bacterium]
MSEEFKSWEEIEKELNITSEQEAEIQLEMDIIKATIEARKKSNLSQRELSKKAGIKQPVIARIESRARSPQVTTLLKILYPMGYTLKVVPIKKENKQ